MLLALVMLMGCGEPRYRKSVKELTSQEKEDFVNAVLLLKQRPSPFDRQASPSGKQLSWYDPERSPHFSEQAGKPRLGRLMPEVGCGSYYVAGEFFRHQSGAGP
jgi:hypothetical protein